MWKVTNLVTGGKVELDYEQAKRLYQENKNRVWLMLQEHFPQVEWIKDAPYFTHKTQASLDGYCFTAHASNIDTGCVLVDVSCYTQEIMDGTWQESVRKMLEWRLEYLSIQGITGFSGQICERCKALQESLGKARRENILDEFLVSMRERRNEI
jgi:hypothetical protein